MRLKEGKIMLTILDVNETEEELLKRFGFTKVYKDNAAEVWEYHLKPQAGNPINYYQVGESLILATDGSVYLKTSNGFYIDKDKNEYQYENNQMIPVLINSSHLTEVPHLEITDSAHNHGHQKESDSWDYEVKLADDRYIQIRINTDTGYVCCILDGNGSAVYDYNGNPIWDYPYDEKKVFKFVKNQYEVEKRQGLYK